MATSNSIIKTKDEEFPQATNFLNKLKKQTKRVNTQLNKSVSFDTNLKKGVMYIRGTTQYEIYMWILYDYINRIPDICMVEFKQPLLGLECIQFQFVSSDIEVQILDDQQLQECVDNRLQSLKQKIGRAHV